MAILNFDPTLPKMLFTAPKLGNIIDEIASTIVSTISTKKISLLSKIPFTENIVEGLQSDLILKRELRDIKKNNEDLLTEYRRSLTKLNVSELIDIQNSILELTKRRLELEGKRDNVDLSEKIEKLNETIRSNELTKESIKLETENNVSVEKVSQEVKEVNSTNSNISATISTLTKDTSEVKKESSKYQETSKEFFDSTDKSMDKVVDYLKSMVLQLNKIHRELVASTGTGISDMLPGGEAKPKRGRGRPRKYPKKVGKIPKKVPTTRLGRLGKLGTGLLTGIGTGIKGVGTKAATLARGAGTRVATTLGARALPALGTAGAVAGAGVAGYGIGTILNKATSKIIETVTKGESKSLGEYLESVRTREVNVVERNENIRKWKPRLSNTAFELAGGEKNFSPINVFTLQRAGKLIYQDNIIKSHTETEPSKLEVEKVDITKKITDKTVTLKEKPFTVPAKMKEEIKKSETLDKVVATTAGRPIRVESKPQLIPLPPKQPSNRGFRPSSDSIVDSGVDAIRTFLS